MGFFEEAKHKAEEVVGRVEETLGGAFGNAAMQASGHAHAEHGEALSEEDEAREMRKDQPSENAEQVNDVATDDAVLQERRDQEQKIAEIDRKIHEAKRAQDAVADSGEQMRHADADAAPTEPA